MQNCHDDIVAFHEERVNLSIDERNEMRARRNANRNRVQSGLKNAGHPTPKLYKSQGSYAMWTMVQQADRDFDIDDGVIFAKDTLIGPRGGAKTAADAKAMVRDAVDSGQFAIPPEVRTNCVRVHYQKGYHVDLPVYRQTRNYYGDGTLELASTDWKASDPESVTQWLRDEDRVQSPDAARGVGQLRRIVRILKFFARSRNSWRGQIASGFMITALVVENFQPDADREDRALYRTMLAIRDRLETDLEIEHPTVAGEFLTKVNNEGRTKFLRERLNSRLRVLDTLIDGDCTREEALEAWDKVFATDFFRRRSTTNSCAKRSGDRTSPSKAAAVTGARKPNPRGPVDKRGGGRYA